MEVTTYSLISAMDFKIDLTILGDAGNGWAKVSSSGREGFVKTEFLQSGQARCRE